MSLDYTERSTYFKHCSTFRSICGRGKDKGTL